MFKKNRFVSKFSISVIGIFILIPIILITLKYTVWGYSYKKILPKTSYDVSIQMDADSYGDALYIKTYVPMSDSRQNIYNEVLNSPGFTHEVISNEFGRESKWYINNADGKFHIDYSFSFMGKALQFNIDSLLIPETNIPPGLNNFLESTENIQINHPVIEQIYQDKIARFDKTRDILRAIMDYTYGMKSKSFKGLTDAVTAAKLNEASCNGKSRLFVALARKAGIPSRLVGGLILTDGQKRTSHQWVEAYINGYWVPFDPLNKHFAYIPDNYLLLYRGDKFLFAHSPNINFNYLFNIKKRLVANPMLIEELHETPFNAYNAWQAFQKVGIPLGLLKLIIMLPLGALFIAIFRNVIGIQTFGIFLPALIALSCRETGLFYGLLGFIFVVGIVSILHFPLEKLGLLYIPKMAIMLSAVVITFLTVAALAINFQLYELSYISLFPIAVVTITAERFGRQIVEESFKDAVRLTFQTLIVAALVYFIINSRTMQAFILAFPELLLAIIGLNILLGRWIGLRVTEYYRFRWLMKPSNP